MIKLTPQRKYHVSNRLAVLAALVLVITSYVGFVNGTAFDREYVEHASVTVNQQESQAVDTSVKKRKLNISLLLFGRG